MKLRIIFLCALFVGIFYSCKKDEPITVGTITPGKTSLLLTKILTDNQPSSEYVYNDMNLISEEKSKFDFTLNHYNDKNQLISSDYYSNFDILSNDLLVYQAAINNQTWVAPLTPNIGGSISYEYGSDGNLTKTTYTPASGSTQVSTFTYDGSGRITKQMLYWADSETGYIDYTYDTRGNLAQEMLYNMTPAGDPELSTTTTYEYDNQQNPFEAVSKLMTPGIYTNPNNVVKETYTISMQAEKGADVVEVTTSTYVYNTQGYPVSKNGNVLFIYGS